MTKPTFAPARGSTLRQATMPGRLRFCPRCTALFSLPEAKCGKNAPCQKRLFSPSKRLSLVLVLKQLIVCQNDVVPFPKEVRF